MAKVVFKNVTSSLDKDVVGEDTLRNFNVCFEDHEFTVLTGGSACGKRRVFRLLAGLERLSSGEIFVGQDRIDDVSPPNRDVAVVLRKEVFYPALSVSDNITLGLKLRRISAGEIRKRVTDAASLMGVSDLLTSFPGKISRFDLIRVSMTRAVARQPKVFLFEDPFADLEWSDRARMRSELVRLHQTLDATIIHLTDDVSEVMALGTKTLIMDRGEIAQVDTLAKLYSDPANLLVASFLGIPSMNLIQGVVSRSSERIVFKEDNRGTIELNLSGHPAAEAAVGRKVVLGVRPEDCRVVSQDSRSEGQVFRALADHIEPSGADTLFYLQTGAHSLVARCAGLVEQAAIGHRVQFLIAAERVHLFDPDSTLRIDRAKIS